MLALFGWYSWFCAVNIMVDCCLRSYWLINPPSISSVCWTSAVKITVEIWKHRWPTELAIVCSVWTMFWHHTYILNHDCNRSSKSKIVASQLQLWTSRSWHMLCKAIDETSLQHRSSVFKPSNRIPSLNVATDWFQTFRRIPHKSNEAAKTMVDSWFPSLLLIDKS